MNQEVVARHVIPDRTAGALRWWKRWEVILFAVAVAHSVVGSAYQLLAPKAIPATYATFGRYLAEQRKLFSQIETAVESATSRNSHSA